MNLSLPASAGRAIRWTLLGVVVAAVLVATAPAALGSLAELVRVAPDRLPWVATRLIGFLSYYAIAGSVIYQKRAMLGYECLAPGFEARRSPPPDRVRLLLIPAGAERLPRISHDLPGFREFSGSLYRADLPSGPLWLSGTGGCLTGVAGELPREEAERILAALGTASKGPCTPTP